MQQIKLSNSDRVALVDDEDAERVRRWKWRLMDCGYAHAYVGGGRGASKALMHRFIVGAVPGQDWDHANGNKLDNRRSNLRPATTSQNIANAKVRAGRQYKGVHYYKARNRYQAYIRKEGVDYRLGYWDTAEEAASAYDQAAVYLFGSYARLNFPEASYPDEMPDYPKRKHGSKPTTFRDAISKECVICHQVKPRSEFPPGSRKPGSDPNDSRCRECNNQRRNKYR